MTKWIIQDDDGVKHVMPDKDTKAHLVGVECPCDPVENEGVFVHNSWDRREILEQAVDAIENRD